MHHIHVAIASAVGVIVEFELWIEAERRVVMSQNASF